MVTNAPAFWLVTVSTALSLSHSHQWQHLWYQHRGLWECRDAVADVTEGQGRGCRLCVAARMPSQQPPFHSRHVRSSWQHSARKRSTAEPCGATAWLQPEPRPNTGFFRQMLTSAEGNGAITAMLCLPNITVYLTQDSRQAPAKDCWACWHMEGTKEQIRVTLPEEQYRGNWKNTHK